MKPNRFNLRAYVKKYNKVYRVVSFFDNEFFHLEDYKSKFIIKNDNNEHLDPHSFSLNEIELMQSTGMVDKNGKEIFEGDIIEFSTFKVVVKWEDCRFKLKSSCCDLALDIIRAEQCEVLGNIYENKELLEEFRRK